MTCRHPKTKIVVARERCYSGPTDGEPNPAAHGWSTWTDTCSACHAERDVNQNGRQVENGRWHKPVRQFVGRRGSGSGYFVWVGAISGVFARAARAWEDAHGRWTEGIDLAGLAQLPAEARHHLGL